MLFFFLVALGFNFWFSDFADVLIGICVYVYMVAMLKHSVDVISIRVFKFRIYINIYETYIPHINHNDI